MFARHSIARSLSLSLCWNDWITHPFETRGFNHLFNLALAVPESHFFSLQFFQFSFSKDDSNIVVLFPRILLRKAVRSAFPVGPSGSISP